MIELQIVDLRVSLFVRAFLILFAQVEYVRGQEGGQPLPTKFTQIKCGESYYIHDEEFMKFKLDKPDKCEIALLGTRIGKCTVEIMCPQLETNGPKSSKCTSDYMRITDALGGELKGCGNISLTNPYKATNEGSDLFLAFKGISSNSYCQVFCAQDKPFYKELKDKVSQAIMEGSNSMKIEQSCVCGVKGGQEGRIVGGDSALEFEYPWIGAITYSKPSPQQNISLRAPFCGGSLITDRHILTAAHCFVNSGMLPEDIHVVLHAHVMDLAFLRRSTTQKEIEKIPGWDLPPRTDKIENSIRLEVAKIIPHPFYDEETYDFDVTILLLKNRVNLKRKDMVRTVCLPLPAHFSEIPGSNIEVAGWGKYKERGAGGSRILQKVQVPFIPWNKCNERVGGDLTLRHMCAGFVEKGGKDACQGDSGGPAIYKLNSEQWVQRGVVSAGTGCARPGHPGLYTNTIVFKEVVVLAEVNQWIRHTTRKGIWCKNS